MIGTGATATAIVRKNSTWGKKAAQPCGQSNATTADQKVAGYIPPNCGASRLHELSGGKLRSRCRANAAGNSDGVFSFATLV